MIKDVFLVRVKLSLCSLTMLRLLTGLSWACIMYSKTTPSPVCLEKEMLTVLTNTGSARTIVTKLMYIKVSGSNSGYS